MNLTLERYRFTEDGIFGHLFDEKGTIRINTLEHSFGDQPKLADGTYTCQRGMHQLEHMTAPFETFEVCGVPEFEGVPVWGILFHVGNFNIDSNGCILLGLAAADSSIISSKEAFGRFMKAQEGTNEFTLQVTRLS